MIVSKTTLNRAITASLGVLMLTASVHAETGFIDKVNLSEVNVQTNVFAQFGYYQTGRDSAYTIPGVLTDTNAFHYEEGLQFMHGELGFLASLDQVLATKLVIGSHHGDAVELEELWLQPYLHQDWTLRLGRQLSEIGLYNSTHEHDWRFLDASLTQQAFLGNQYSDDAVQANCAQNQYDVTLWVGRGDAFPAQYDTDSASPAAFGLHTQWHHLRSDYQLNLVASLTYFKAHQRQADASDNHGHAHPTDINIMFDGDTTLASFGGNLQWGALNWQLEWMGQRLESTLTDSQQIRSELDAFQHGITTQLSWQFEDIEVAARYDWLTTDNDVTQTSSEFEQALDANGHNPQRISAIANWQIAPFQLVRFQTNYESITQQNQLAFWLVYQGNLTW